MKITRHTELDVYKKAFKLAMEVFDLTKKFPREETYSLTDQFRRASRSVCSNIAEGWRKRLYEAAFCSKVSDSDAEAAETQTWIEFSFSCAYIPRDTARNIYRKYDEVIAMLVSMRTHPEKWILPSGKKRGRRG